MLCSPFVVAVVCSVQYLLSSVSWYKNWGKFSTYNTDIGISPLKMRNAQLCQWLLILIYEYATKLFKIFLIFNPVHDLSLATVCSVLCLCALLHWKHSPDLQPLSFSQCTLHSSVLYVLQLFSNTIILMAITLKMQHNYSVLGTYSISCP
jgi:hypothetical protein